MAPRSALIAGNRSGRMNCDGAAVRQILAALLLCISCTEASAATRLSAEAINAATPTGWKENPEAETPDPLVIRVQVLLDRAHLSPGVIDGLPGDNLTKAIRVFEQREGLQVDGKVDDQFWQALSRDSAPIMQTYKVTRDDLNQRYLRKVPEDFGEMAKLKWLGYTGPKEMLAERFHLGESLLQQLNPDIDFKAAGAEIIVPVVRENATEKVTRISVERSHGQLLAYAGDRLIVAYPATIGSENNPSPSGTHKVKAVVKDPPYSYDPKKNFQQGDNDKPLEIPPGPNGPVGSVWIDLSEPTYGIHGTPEPDLIDKVGSHGCVRLTNWDALELADLVKAGVPVEFVE
jgi:lipoprotein-anchoring transpeptidase ErfK/SrfK